jgi:hypothetical protein
MADLQDIHFDPHSLEVGDLDQGQFDGWVLLALYEHVHGPNHGWPGMQSSDVREELNLYETQSRRVAGSLRRQSNTGLVSYETDAYGRASYQLTDAGIARALELAPSLCPAPAVQPMPEWQKRLLGEDA